MINLTERLVVTVDQSLITAAQLPVEYSSKKISKYDKSSLKAQVEALEQQLINEAIEEYGTTRAAANALSIDQSTLVKKQKRWRINESKNIS